MGTAKRERQRANKANREQEVARDAAKSRTLRLSLLIGGAIIAVFVIVAIVGPLVLGDDETDNDDNDEIIVEDDVTTTVVPADATSDEG